MTGKACRVLVLPAAKRDIFRIWHELAEINPSAADKLLIKIDKRVVDLRAYPERGAPRDELAKGIRILVEGKYLIFYRVTGRNVEIVRVVHGAQDLVKTFR